MRSYRHHLTALLGYLSLTLLLTYPLARQFAQAIPGDGFDGWQNVWNLWWVKRALLVEGTHPYFTHLIDYPAGVYLYFHTLNVFNGLAFLPLTLSPGPLVAYNAAVIFSFAAGGYGAYLLVLYALRSGPASPGVRHLAAFVGGAVYAFSPYHMAHLLGHMQLISLEWLPFYSLFLMKAVAHPRPWSAGGRRYVALAALCLALVAACDWYYAFYMALFSALFWAWSAARRRRWLAPTLATGAVGLLFAVLMSPLLVPMAREALTHDYMVPPPNSIERLSADLTAFVTPSQLHPVWGSWAAGWADRFTATTSERTVFAGYSVLALAVLGWRMRRRAAGFWGLVALVFGVLALGPQLHIGGQTQFLGIGPIPLPYALLHSAVPLLRISRSVSRFDVMVMLSLGVLAAMGLHGLLQRLRQAHLGRLNAGAAALSALGIVCLEFLAAPYPMSLPETRPFHYQLAQEAGDFAVMDIPMDWDRPANLLYQTVHQKPMVSGYTSRDNPLAPAWRTPVLQTFRYLGPDVNSGDAHTLAATVLADLGVRYVIVHKTDLPPGEYRQTTLALADAVFAGWPVVVEDDWLKVFRVPDRVSAPLPYLTLEEGWSARQWQAGQPSRAIAGGLATLSAHMPASQLAHLEIEAYSPDGPQPLQIQAGPDWTGTFQLGPQLSRLVTPAFPLPAAESPIRLQSNPSIGEVIVTRVDLVMEGSAAD